MKKIEFLYKDLEKYKDFDIDGNCEKFLDTVDKIVLCKNPESIEILLRYFDDHSDYSWVLTSLRKSIEHYPIEFYIEKIFKNLTVLVKKCPVWLDEFVNSIFNQDNTLNFFKENMYHASKDNLLELFDIVEVESPHHYDLIQELRKELEKKL